MFSLLFLHFRGVLEAFHNFQGLHDFHYVNVADRYVLVSLCCCLPGFTLIMNICYVSITVLHEIAPDVALNAVFIFSLLFSLANAHKFPFFMFLIHKCSFCCNSVVFCTT